jgi:molybdate transport system substrate-binding protein
VTGRALAALAALLLTACSTGSAQERRPEGLSGTVTVLAAASLTEVVEELAERFEAEHPDVDVRLSLGPSSRLAAQVVAGAPADVFASASPRDMGTVVEAGLASSPRVFARNSAQIAVPPDDPAGVGSVADLARPGVKVALCAPEVPCGRLAQAVLAAAGVTVVPVTLESDVRAVLTKVQLGEVDAGMVYVTDVRAAGDRVKGVDVPLGLDASTDYPVAALGERPAPAARAFVELLLSATGREVLAAEGFQLP